MFILIWHFYLISDWTFATQHIFQQEGSVLHWSLWRIFLGNSFPCHGLTCQTNILVWFWLFLLADIADWFFYIFFWNYIKCNIRTGFRDIERSDIDALNRRTTNSFIKYLARILFVAHKIPYGCSYWNLWMNFVSLIISAIKYYACMN